MKIASIAVVGLLSVAVRADNLVRFNRDIRPIMSDTCFRCHGPDQRARMAGLRLDIRDQALKKTKSGVTPIVPGDPDRSAIVQRIFDESGVDDAAEDAHKELTNSQKETIRRWVAEGAVYEKHWSYEPLKRPAVPEIHVAKVPNRNPIDAFIQERLQREGLEPSPEADRRTLLRRVTFDLAGIPPTPAEMQAFLSDQSPDAYEKVVDRLLASPRYAEIQTMHWLDAVRYADSAGFHGDNLWPAWPYRDYVLRAFRDNKPFDEFTREQLAGDLSERHHGPENCIRIQSPESGFGRRRTAAEGISGEVRSRSGPHAQHGLVGSTLGCGGKSATITNYARHGVTNELLKLIPAFRESERRLMVCATNSVHSLDSAFRRPGRFDYVIPVGPPDAPARRAVWQRYLGTSAVHVDLDRLVEASELFTPADIEFASRKGSQAAFEREVSERSGRPATTEDYLAAIADTRPTLTTEILTEFEEDRERFTRL